jgi:hypothetical protein
MNRVGFQSLVISTPHYLTLLCKVYHFGRGVGTKTAFLVPNCNVGGLVEGDKAVRSIPWSQIEVINELPASTDWDVRARVYESGLCVLDNENKTVITRAMNARPG